MGNSNFATPTHRTPTESTPGEEGEADGKGTRLNSSQITI